MFISVDFPAPFSPSSAWTSPGSSSKSTASFASTPGNCLVIPRISRTGPAALIARDSTVLSRACEEMSCGRAVPARPHGASARLELRRRLDLAGDDLLLDDVHLRDERLRHLLADATDVLAAVLQVEHEVAARLERARLV